MAILGENLLVLTCFDKNVEEVSKEIQELRNSSTRKIIATHSGAFHLDEVTAVYLLSLLYPVDTLAVVRTRVPSIWELADMSVDVGGIYDPSLHKYDHHQKSFGDFFSEEDKKTKMSSVGLVWLHFGKEILKKHYQIDEQSEIEFLHKMCYKMIFESMDGTDNGVPQCRCESNFSRRIFFPPALNGLIGKCNPGWDDLNASENESGCFKKALAIAEEEVSEIMTAIVKGYSAARIYLSKKFDEREQFHPSKQWVEATQFKAWHKLYFGLEHCNDKLLAGVVDPPHLTITLLPSKGAYQQHQDWFHKEDLVAHQISAIIDHNVPQKEETVPQEETVSEVPASKDTNIDTKEEIKCKYYEKSGVLKFQDKESLQKFMDKEFKLQNSS